MQRKPLDWGRRVDLVCFNTTKLFFKEDLIPNQSDRFVFKLAPYLAFVLSTVEVGEVIACVHAVAAARVWLRAQDLFVG